MSQYLGDYANFMIGAAAAHYIIDVLRRWGREDREQKRLRETKQ